jgi:hypothetical protein
MQFIRHIGRTFHFNPGSIGFAYRHSQHGEHFQADPWALLSSYNGRLSLEFRRVNFDVKLLVDAYRSSGKPYSDGEIAQYGIE